jgi:hypothetical protein
MKQLEDYEIDELVDLLNEVKYQLPALEQEIQNALEILGVEDDG